MEGGIALTRAGSIHSGANDMRENTCACALSMYGRTNAHARSGPLVHIVVTHVAPPHDVSAALDQRGDEPSGLRVVDDDDVTRPNLSADPRDVRGSRPLVDSPLAQTKISPVPGRTVEAVVNTLRNGKELWFSYDDEPVGLDADTAHIADQGGQHLGDTASGRR